VDDRVRAVDALKRFATNGLAVGMVLLAAVLITSLFIVAAGKSPAETIASMIGYSLGTANGFAEVMVRTIPLTLTGLGIAIAFRANVFNIGADGQLIVGAIVATALAGLAAPLPGPLAACAFLLFGFIGGALYGAIAGWLKARYGASEIIVTIMLNYVALQLLAWVVRGPLQESSGIFPRSDLLPASVGLDVLVAGSRIHWGLVVAVFATVAVFVLMRYLSLGYQLKIVGINPNAARYAGIDDRVIVFVAMALSGGLAGIAGAGEIAGLHDRLQDNFAPGFGVISIAVALLARLNPLAVPASALLFGVLHVGSGAVQREVGLPFPIVWVIEGVVILGFLALGAMGRLRSDPAAVQ